MNLESNSTISKYWKYRIAVLDVYNLSLYAEIASDNYVIIGSLVTLATPISPANSPSHSCENSVLATPTGSL